MKYRQIGLSLLVAASLAAPAFAQTRVQQNGLDAVNQATVSNPVPVQVDVSGAAASASNPQAVQLSQGAAVLSATNPVPAQITDGTAVNAAGHPLFTTPATLTAANATNISGSVGGTAATVSLANASKHIKIANNHATQLLYVNFSATAVADATAYAIGAGKDLTVDFPAGISSFSVIGSGSSTTYSVFSN